MKPISEKELIEKLLELKDMETLQISEDEVKVLLLGKEGED